MELSILIPLYHGEKVFKKCIDTLYKSGSQVIGKKWEIIVVNNGFDKKKLEEFKKDYPKVKFIGSGKNIGFARGNNLALKKSKGKYILLLNQDVFITKGKIDKLIKFLEDNPKYGVVAPQLRYKDGRPQYTSRPFPAFHLFIADILFRGKYYHKSFSPDESQEVPQPMASCMLWKGKDLRKLKGFDEHPHFFLFFNDAELSYRYHLAGGKSYYLSSVWATHLHGSSTALFPEAQKLTHLFKGLGRFWYSKTGNNFLWAYFKAGIATLALGILKIFKSLFRKAKKPN